MRYLTAAFCALAITASADVKSVCGLGGSPKGNAAAIQRTIDAVAAAGGGRVSIPAGTWLTGTIYLKSHVELHLPEGARLVGSSDLNDYNRLDAFPQNYGSVSEGWSARHLILALEQTDVAVTGEGTVDGNGKAFFGDKPEVFGETWWREGGVNARDREHQGRPGQLIEFVECRNVRVENIRIEDSPCWSCFFYGCDDVSVRGLRIENPPRHLNTDGIDIDSCRRVSVRDCAISTGDDAIAIRCAPKRLADPSRICEDVSIESCTLGSSADGIRIGVGTGTIRNVRISNVAINRAGTGFHVQSVFGKSSGVDISGVRLSDSRISGAARAFEIIGTPEKRPRDIVISRVAVEDAGLVERSLAAVGEADEIRFCGIEVMPCGLGTEAAANRVRIQRSVEAVSGVGGGRVLFPKGTWPTGSIELKSGVELHLGKDVTLKGSVEKSDYNANDAFVGNRWNDEEEWSGGHLVYGHAVTNVAITGEGTIDGSGSSFFGGCDEPDRRPWYRYGLKLHPKDRTWFRPGFMVAFFKSKDVRIAGVRLVDSPCWTVHFRCCEKVEVTNVAIENDQTIANSDGLSVDCTRDVSICGCRIVTGDDGIALRASCPLHAKKNPCADIRISDCDIWSCCFGIRLGIGRGTVRDVAVSDCRIHEGAQGIGFTPAWAKQDKSVDIERIRFLRCSVQNVERAVLAWMPERGATLKDVRFDSCRLDSTLPPTLCGTAGGRVEDVRFRWCELKFPVETNAHSVGVETEPFSLEVETGNAIHVLAPGESLVVVLRNGSDQPRDLDVRLRFDDFYGRGFDIPCRQRIVKGGETVRKTLPPPGRMGYWRLTGEFRSKGFCTTTTCDFAVLEQRKATPAWGADEFRFGVNSHLPWYPKDVRKPCLEALVAVGAKLVRTDMFAPSDICPHEGVWDWSDHESILRSLEERGIALHTIIYGCPRWACARRDEKHRHGITCPMRPGLYESYCRTLAARYGTRIAFYEIGNEWDMTPVSRLSDDAAIAMQAEAMRGLHAGCSNVVCVANGWASPPTAPASERRIGLHRKLIGEHPDSYDVYAIHCHGLFRWYEPAIRETLAFLKEKGIDKPWYSDESALSASDGKEVESARTVWKKCLFAWSHGSIGHVWYNLRATGTDPKNEEHGYGLFTMDFHPRPSAAAYSALTSLFARLRTDAILTDNSELFVARWRGQREGRPVVVLAGWRKTSGKATEERIPVAGERAWRVDLMGNRTTIPVVGGCVTCTWTEEPSAVLVEE